MLFPTTFASLGMGMLASSAAGHAHGLPNRPHHAVRGNDDAPEICASTNDAVYSTGTQYWPYQAYRSSNATPPWMQITRSGSAPQGDGYIFFAQNPFGGTRSPKQQYSALIMDDKNRLVWAGPNNGEGVTDVKVQSLNGKPVITYATSEGDQPTVGVGYGSVRILDGSYKELHRVCPQVGLTKFPGKNAPCDSDLHEHVLTHNGTLFHTAYNLTQADLTSIGGTKDAWVLDPLAVETDINTGKPLWTWSALAHVPLNTVKLTPPSQPNNANDPFDPFHMNSIQPIGDDYILINCRHVWSTFLVDRAGNVKWTIRGDDGGDFGNLPAGGNFSWQHHARLQQLSSNQAVLSYFNNANNDQNQNITSTGTSLLLTLPPNPNSPPQLLSAVYDSNNAAYSWAEGSFTELSNGNYFLGYGSKPVIKEFAPPTTSVADKAKNPLEGAQAIWSARFADLSSSHSYRAFKSNWTGMPYYPPSLVVGNAGDDLPGTMSCGQKTDSTRTGFVSWNGATEVSSYALKAGSDPDSRKVVAKFGNQGFETAFILPSDVTSGVVSVQAFNSNGDFLGETATVYL